MRSMKKGYSKPELIVHGDIQTITQQDQCRAEPGGAAPESTLPYRIATSDRSADEAASSGNGIAESMIKLYAV